MPDEIRFGWIVAVMRTMHNQEVDWATLSFHEKK